MKNTPVHKDIIILGGGISGLSLAANLGNRDYVLFEKEETLGGLCRTTTRGEYVWDYSGHFFHFTDEKVRDLLLRNIQCEILEIEKKTSIYYKGKFIDFPFQYNIHQLPFLEFIQCLTGLRTSRGASTSEKFVPYLHRSSGVAISEKFIIPYNTKLYSCDLDELDPSCMGRFFPEISIQSYATRMLRGSNYKSYNDTFIYPRGGAYEFIKSVECSIADKTSVHLGESVSSINLEKKEVYTNRGHYTFNKLVSTLPLSSFTKLSGEGGSELTSNKVVVFNIGFNKPGTILDHWVYFPHDTIFYRVGFYSNILSSENMSIYVEIGMKTGEIVDEHLLYVKVLEDLRKVGIITNQEVSAYEMLVLNPAYVHITKESKKYYDKWCQANNPNGIYSTGRYGSWTYCSIEDNIKQALNLINLL